LVLVGFSFPHFSRLAGVQKEPIKGVAEFFHLDLA
jgi:hypothetical protein